MQNSRLFKYFFSSLYPYNPHKRDHAELTESTFLISQLF